MSDTLTISLDVEGVLANTHERMLKIYNEEHGTEYTFEDIDDWDWVRDEIEFSEFMEIVRRGWNITPRQVRAFESHLGEVAHNLTHLGELDIVTERLGCKVGMREWFEEHGITEYNQLRTVNPGTSKADLGYDIYIDDKPHLADEISDEQIVCLIRRPYNTHKRASQDGVMKAETVHEASVKLLNRLAEI